MKNFNKVKSTLYVDMNNPAQVAAFMALLSVMGDVQQQDAEQATSAPAATPKKRTRRTTAKKQEAPQLTESSATAKKQEAPQLTESSATAKKQEAPQLTESSATEEAKEEPKEEKAAVKKTTTRKTAAKKATAKKPEAKESEKSDFSVMDIRKAMQPKVKNNRAALKNKLTELGASGVTTLDVAKYAEFHDFLETLDD